MADQPDLALIWARTSPIYSMSPEGLSAWRFVFASAAEPDVRTSVEVEPDHVLVSTDSGQSCAEEITVFDSSVLAAKVLPLLPPELKDTLAHGFRIEKSAPCTGFLQIEGRTAVTIHPEGVPGTYLYLFDEPATLVSSCGPCSPPVDPVECGCSLP